MIDFKALRDREVQARLRAERDEEDRRREEKDNDISAILNKCLAHYETLSERERSLVSSCRSRVSTYLQLSDAQEKWLRDIASRVPD